MLFPAEPGEFDNAQEFIGTVRASDFSPASMSGLRPLAFPDPPAADCSAGTDESSQFLCKELLRMLRFYDRVEPTGDSRKRPQQCCLPHSTTASALQIADYAAQ